MTLHPLLSLALGLCIANGACSQSSCSSDGQPAQGMLDEHFMSADCGDCWRSPRANTPGARTLSIDWIVPGGQGDDAPLSAAASRDAQMRLAELGVESPDAATDARTKVSRNSLVQLRVVHGKRVGDYIGAIIELRSKARARLHKPLKAWLLLVEAVPAGVEGTPVARNLVRNALVVTWREPDQVLKDGRRLFRELRPLNVPQTATMQHLRVVGWVQDADGRVLSAAQSVCPAAIDAQ